MWDQASVCPLALSETFDSEDEDDGNSHCGNSQHGCSDGSMQDDPSFKLHDNCSRDDVDDTPSPKS